MDVYSTGYQFSNIWLRIEGDNALSVATDDGTELLLTVEEAVQLSDTLADLVADHHSIYTDPTAEDDDV